MRQKYRHKDPVLLNTRYEVFVTPTYSWLTSPININRWIAGNTLVLALQSFMMLIEDLLQDGYDYSMTKRLLADHFEEHFSQHS